VPIGCTFEHPPADPRLDRTVDRIGAGMDSRQRAKSPAKSANARAGTARTVTVFDDRRDRERGERHPSCSSSIAAAIPPSASCHISSPPHAAHRALADWPHRAAACHCAARWINPAPFNIFKCYETAGRLTGRPSAITVTGRGAARIRSKTRRRVGSESAANAASTYHCRQALSDVHDGARWLRAVPCSSRTSARTLGLLRSEMAASAGFPNQANNFPKPAKPEPNRRPKTRFFLGRAGNFG
jgi:hypothetical protein